jgi:hypothetical protein
MLLSTTKFCGTSVILICDAQCNKAWGVNSRPIDDETNEWIADFEQEAPADPGTYEGGSGKPDTPRHNPWCARECERSLLVSGEMQNKPIDLPKWNARKPSWRTE